MASQFFDAVDSYDGAPVAKETPAAGRVFERPQVPAGDTKTFLRGIAVGFALAIVGVAVGRWSARR
jgi:hypothetical protein